MKCPGVTKLDGGWVMPLLYIDAFRLFVLPL